MVFRKACADQYCILPRQGTDVGFRDFSGRPYNRAKAGIDPGAAKSQQLKQNLARRSDSSGVPLVKFSRKKKKKKKNAKIHYHALPNDQKSQSQKSTSSTVVKGRAPAPFPPKLSINQSQDCR